MFLNEIQLSNKSYYNKFISRRSYDTLSPQKRGTFLRCIFKDEQNENKLSGNFYILVQFHFKFLFKQGFLIRRQVLWIIRNLQALFGIKIKLGFFSKRLENIPIALLKTFALLNQSWLLYANWIIKVNVMTNINEIISFSNPLQ